jgi:dTDP-4-amino-4,6-dideoxygalactose transaminase
MSERPAVCGGAGVPFMDLGCQWREIAADVLPEVQDLFERSAYCLGPYVTRFEEAFAAHVGVKHVVGVNSGTSALHLAYLVAGIGPGDRVLVPGYTFVATAWGVRYAGATPVFCDVDPDTGNIDVRDAERRMGPGVTAIVPVHLYGQPADLDAVFDMAERHGMTVIEDAAQAHGARYRGRVVGGLGLLGCYSFYPGKNLGAAGEAGVVVTDDDALAERLRSLRDHGQQQRYRHEEVGFNYRMEGLQGLVLWHKLQRLEDWTRERKARAGRYLEALAGLPLALPLPQGGDHVYHLFVVRTPQRDALRSFLDSHGIQSGLHYPIALHQQPCFADLPSAQESLPSAEAFAGECLSLPFFHGMTDGQQGTVIDAVKAFFAEQ